jgi:Carboxypeptidase regulatory-like domain
MDIYVRGNDCLADPLERSVTERWMARQLRTVALACAGSVLPGPVIACICVNEPVTVVWAKGRVFALSGRLGPEAIRDATVELSTRRDHTKVAVTTTDADGMFELTTPPPGEYLIRVSLAGFLSTEFPVRIKKGRRGAGGRLAVRLDIPTDCTCGDACVSKPDRRGNAEPKCLVERRKLSLIRVQPPNNGLKLTAARWHDGRAAAV